MTRGLKSATVLVALSLVVLGRFAAPADADGEPGVVCHAGICFVGAGGGRAHVGHRAGEPDCTWKTVTVACSTADGTFSPSDGCYYRAADPSLASGVVKHEYDSRGGSIVFASCPFGGTGGFLWEPPAKPVVTASMVRARVARMIPTAALSLAPKGATLVNIQTVMWVDAPAAQDLPAVQILGQRVLIHLSADSVRYDFGDGAVEDGPVGKPYDEANDPCKTRLCPDYYGHIYTKRGVEKVTATAYWRASFTVDGGQRQQIRATVPGPGSQAMVTVREARAVLVPTP